MQNNKCIWNISALQNNLPSHSRFLANTLRPHVRPNENILRQNHWLLLRSERSRDALTSSCDAYSLISFRRAWILLIWILALAKATSFISPRWATCKQEQKWSSICLFQSYKKFPGTTEKIHKKTSGEPSCCYCSLALQSNEGFCRLLSEVS